MGLVMEPQALGTLRPGGTMWLPALRAHTGLLCLRPAATLGWSPLPPPLPPAPPPAPPSAAGDGQPRLHTAATWQPGSSAGGSRIPSLAADSLAAAAALVAGHAHAGASLPLPAQRMPSSPLLYSTAGLASPNRLSTDYLDAAARQHQHQQQHQAAGGAAAPWHAYDWSVAVSLQTLLRQAASAEAAAAASGRGAMERSSGSRKLTCEPTVEGQPPVLVCMGATRLGGKGSGSSAGVGARDGSAAATAGGATASGFTAGGSWEVQLSAPLVLHNALPVPADVSLVAYGKPHRLQLQPNQHAALHAVDASAVDHIVLRAQGYHPTRPITPAPLPALAALADAGGGGGREIVGPDTDLFLQVCLEVEGCRVAG